MKSSSQLDRKATELMTQLDALGRRFMLQDKKVRKDNLALTRQEFRLLLILGPGPACTMGELAKRMMLSVSSLTTLVDKLVDKNLVRREHAQDDRRVVRVALTKLGHRLHAQGRRHRLRMARAMLEALNEREQDIFLALATKIGDSARGSDRPTEVSSQPPEKA